MMYASHVRGTPAQQPLRSPLHSVRNNHGQWYTKKRWQMADKRKRNEQNGKGPEEDESAQEPPRVFHSRDGELPRVSILVEASFHESATPLPGGIHLLRRDLWRLAVVVLGEPVRSVLEQLLYRSLTALDKRPMQCREALVVRRIYVGTPSEKQVHARRIALVCRPHERGVTLRICDIHGYVLV